MKGNLMFLAGSLCALLLSIPAVAANSAKMPVANRARQTAMRAAWPPENLSGTILMVDPAQKLLVVQTSSGIPFDMVVTPRTRIKSGSQAMTLQQLSGDTNKGVSVRFVPERRGDIARTIQIGG
jgi:hypothetical protein